MKCRFCRAELTHMFLDLGFAPPSNAYLTVDDLNRPEKYFPLRTKVCDQCWLVQTEDYADAGDLFSADYAYFSSTSTSWLKHAADFSHDIIQRLGLNKSSMVIEVACNDGYLLKNFVGAGIPCLGIEPTTGTAAAAQQQGITVIRDFFDEKLANEITGSGHQADLVIGNNVYAHVPDITGFTNGLRAVLKPGGTITLEFPHLLQLVQNCQFDTVYHEHFSYFSLRTVQEIFEACSLRIFDVEEIDTHGGSLRIYGCHSEDERQASSAVDELLEKEARSGLRELKTYQQFQSRADCIKNELLSFLIEKKREGKRVVAYGAAAKGNTLLNYAGIKTDLLPLIYDASLSKQGKFMPGSHIPIVPPSAMDEELQDYVLIIP